MSAFRTVARYLWWNDASWVPYSDELSARIEAARVAGDTAAQVDIDGERFVQVSRDAAGADEFLQQRYDDPDRQRTVKRVEERVAIAAADEAVGVFDECVVAFVGGDGSAERAELERLVDEAGGVVAHNVKHKRVSHVVLLAGAAPPAGLDEAVLFVNAAFVRDSVDGAALKDARSDAYSASATTKKRKDPPVVAAAAAAVVPSSSASSPMKKAKKAIGVRAVVDKVSGYERDYHVVDDGGDGGAWDAMLNQTNISKNNNKFYKLQLLKANARPEWRVWFRWGRVGASGQSSSESFSSLDAAKSAFKKKFREKTKNDWDSRLVSFVKYDGKYDLVHISYADEDDHVAADDDDDRGAGRREPEAVPARPSTSVPSSGFSSKKPVAAAAAATVSSPTPTPTPSVAAVSASSASTSAAKSALHAHSLPETVAKFVALICDVKAMSDYMLEMDIDTAKMPLGKLSKKQIHKGYEILKRVEAELKGGNSKAVFLDCSNQFYTLIPHAFGMKRPPILDNVLALEAKLTMLASLAEMEVAIKLLALGDKFEHPLTANYKALKCGMTPVARDAETFGLLARYVARTHAATHDWFTLEVVDVLEADRAGEREAFAKYKHLRRQMLWHGSRTTNFAGIIGQGLRIAPPEAPVTGYMFGKGVYFADSASKSANYCHCTKSQPFGVMAVCEVALGDMLPLRRAEFVTTLPPGKHSTFGVGEWTPDPAGFVTLDGAEVPCGKLIPSGVTKGDGADETDLLYNEFIVYDVAQIRMRYLLKVKFNFK